MPRSLYEKVEELFDAGELDTTYPPSVYTAYLTAQEMSVGKLKTYPVHTADKIAIYYAGYYESRRDFIDCYVTDICGVQIPSTISVDYEGTWKSDLRHHYDFVPDEGYNPDTGAGWYFQKH